MRRQRQPVAIAFCCAAALAFSACVDVTAPVSSTLVTPGGWGATYGSAAGVGLTTDSRSGRNAAFLSAQPTAPSDRSVILSQSILPDTYLGARVRLSAWIKSAQTTGPSAGLWMRVDGSRTTLSFDNMSGRPLVGTVGWRRVSIVLDVPSTAVGISFGALLRGSGAIVVDDMQLEIVDRQVAVTDQLQGVAPDSSSDRALAYGAAIGVPVNLDFEGLPSVGDAGVSWLTANTDALTTTDPTASLNDLAPFGQLVGTAPLVGLGESTHGTREFQRLKHRLVRYLVEQKGFTHLLLEASSPNADEINRYVLTGQGDPVKLLSGLRFWIWNTQEMLDLIRWMRGWNAAAPADRRVQFHGIDIQQPGPALDSVETFIAQVDPARSDEVRSRYACFDPYKSKGATFGAPMTIYAARLATSRAACAAGAREVRDLLVQNAAAYAPRSSAERVALVLHAARLVQQWEAMATNSTASGSLAASRSRDSSMAENVRWYRDRAGSGARLVIWAHNEHIRRSSLLLGRHLQTAYGSEYLAVGLAHGGGVVNAVYGNGTVQAVRPELPPATWLERAFLRTNKPLLLFDARRIPQGGARSAPFAGPITMQMIGSTYSLSSPSGFPVTTALPAHFDALLFVESTTETTLLPFVF